MPKKKHKPEEIVAKLRQADVLISQGQDVADVIRQIGVSEVACEMNCSMVKYSTRYVRPKSSSKVGGATSTQSGRMNR
jgi:putative transposase